MLQDAVDKFDMDPGFKTFMVITEMGRHTDSLYMRRAISLEMHTPKPQECAIEPKGRTS